MASVATADRLVRTLVFEAHIPLEVAVKMGTATPARILGIRRKKGFIGSRKGVDIVLFGTNINFQMTIVNGSIVYERLSST